MSKSILLLGFMAAYGLQLHSEDGSVVDTTVSKTKLQTFRSKVKPHHVMSAVSVVGLGVMTKMTMNANNVTDNFVDQSVMSEHSIRDSAVYRTGSIGVEHMNVSTDIPRVVSAHTGTQTLAEAMKHDAGSQVNIPGVGVGMQATTMMHEMSTQATRDTNKVGCQTDWMHLHIAQKQELIQQAIESKQILMDSYSIDSIQTAFNYVIAQQLGTDAVNVNMRYAAAKAHEDYQNKYKQYVLMLEEYSVRYADALEYISQLFDAKTQECADNHIVTDKRNTRALMNVTADNVKTAERLRNEYNSRLASVNAEHERVIENMKAQHEQVKRELELRIQEARADVVNEQKRSELIEQCSKYEIACAEAKVSTMESDWLRMNQQNKKMWRTTQEAVIQLDTVDFEKQIKDMKVLINLYQKKHILPDDSVLAAIRNIIDYLENMDYRVEQLFSGLHTAGYYEELFRQAVRLPAKPAAREDIDTGMVASPSPRRVPVRHPGSKHVSFGDQDGTYEVVTNDVGVVGSPKRLEYREDVVNENADTTAYKQTNSPVKPANSRKPLHTSELNTSR